MVEEPDADVAVIVVGACASSAPVAVCVTVSSRWVLLPPGLTSAEPDESVVDSERVVLNCLFCLPRNTGVAFGSSKPRTGFLAGSLVDLRSWKVMGPPCSGSVLNVYDVLLSLRRRSFQTALPIGVLTKQRFQ